MGTTSSSTTTTTSVSDLMEFAHVEKQNATTAMGDASKNSNPGRESTTATTTTATNDTAAVVTSRTTPCNNSPLLLPQPATISTTKTATTTSAASAPAERAEKTCSGDSRNNPAVTEKEDATATTASSTTTTFTRSDLTDLARVEESKEEKRNTAAAVDGASIIPQNDGTECGASTTATTATTNDTLATSGKTPCTSPAAASTPATTTSASATAEEAEKTCSGGRVSSNSPTKIMEKEDTTTATTRSTTASMSDLMEFAHVEEEKQSSSAVMDGAPENNPHNRGTESRASSTAATAATTTTTIATNDTEAVTGSKTLCNSLLPSTTSTATATASASATAEEAEKTCSGNPTIALLTTSTAAAATCPPKMKNDGANMTTTTTTAATSPPPVTTSGSTISNTERTTTKSSSTTTATSTTPRAAAAPGPRAIEVLPTEVVDRIAAGEVVQRPVSVIKELLENSLDAGATSIHVTVECSPSGGTAGTAGGGNKRAKSGASSSTSSGMMISKMTVSDNGCGIPPDSLANAAVRHATSKLRSCQDFDTLETFGFRGEALAAVSMVSHMTIVTRVRPQQQQESSGGVCGYKQEYRNGKPVWKRPKPLARTVGTTLTVEDLFANLPHRRMALARGDAEYQRILSCLQHYAIHTAATAGVGLICQKIQNNSSSSSNNKKRGGAKNGSGIGSGMGRGSYNKTDLNTNHLSYLQDLRKALQHHSTTKAMQEDDNDEGDDVDDDPEVLALKEAAAKQVMGQVFGSQVLPHLHPFDSRLDKSKEQEDNSGSQQQHGHKVKGRTQQDDEEDDLMAEGVPVTLPAWYTNNGVADKNNGLLGGERSNGTNSTNPHSSFNASKTQRSTPPVSYSCSGLITTLSYQQEQQQAATTGGAPNGNSRASSKSRVVSSSAASSSSSSQMVLFVNNRLVDFPILKRALDDVYADAARATKRPAYVAYLAITVPATTLDVNVHPTKRVVALLYQQEIVTDICKEVRQVLEETGQAFFPSCTNATTTTTSNGNSKKRQAIGGVGGGVTKNPYYQSNGKKRPREEGHQEEADNHKGKKSNNNGNNGASSFGGSQSDTAANAKKKSKILVRNHRGNTQVGALEPFLVSTQPTNVDRQTLNNRASATVVTNEGEQEHRNNGTADPMNHSSAQQRLQHKPDCPLFASGTSSSMGTGKEQLQSADSLDLSQPGAFAVAASRCNCNADKMMKDMEATTTSAAAATVVRLQPALIRPKKVIPTECSYDSIAQLRTRVDKHRAESLRRLLNKACLVGVVSPHRSLLQSGADLILWNHRLSAQELFYQLALAKFKGGAQQAILGAQGVDIRTVVAQAMQTEQDLDELEQKMALDDCGDDDDNNISERPAPNVSEGVLLRAQEVADCLSEHAEMLFQYFAIKIETKNGGRATLTGLPVLLPGHVPVPSGLALFLWRLATLVDWTEESPCFHGVCRELGMYYAKCPAAAALAADDGEREEGKPKGGSSSTAPLSHDSLQHVVRHVVFPAVSSLLVPTTWLEEREAFIPLTDLSNLYKQFER